MLLGDRVKQVLDNLNILHSLCVVLGIDFKDQIQQIHPTLDDSKGTKNIIDDTIGRLSVCHTEFERGEDTKASKWYDLQLQGLASTMLELWNLMDTPTDEQRMFHNVTSKIAASEPEFTEPECLSMDSISYVEAEVTRLGNLKSSKMKELIEKKSELEEICRRSHMNLEARSLKYFAVEAIEL